MIYKGIQSWFFFFVLTSCHPIYAQLTDNFETNGGAISAFWMGDREDFIIENGMLRLNAAEAGSSILFASYAPHRTQQWSISLRMDFDPSNSNRQRIFLWSDTTALDGQNAIYLLLGKNGSDDAIELWQRTSMNDRLIASGPLGAIANGPIALAIEVSISDDILSLRTDYEGDGCLTIEYEIPIANWPQSAGYFGWICEYTSTRRDKFYYDNIFVGEYIPDQAPPVLIDYIITPFEVELLFSEKLNPNLDLLSIDIEPTIDFIPSIDRNRILLLTGASLIPGTILTAHIRGLEDLRENATDTVLTLQVPLQLKKNDLLISELLFNPSTGGADFLELYNHTDSILNLKGVVIANSTNDREVVVEKDIVIGPRSILALTTDVDDLVVRYPSADANFIVLNELPLFNNDEGNVTILSAWGDHRTILDALDYSEDWHASVLDDLNGVSLERRSYISPTQDAANWSSASEEAGYATPGAPNSNRKENDRQFVALAHKSFRPHQGGNRDEAIVEYSLDLPGYLLSADVFTSEGSHVRSLAKNRLINVTGQLSWDGNDNNGILMQTGIYIIYLEFFNEVGGNSFSRKITTVLVNE